MNPRIYTIDDIAALFRRTPAWFRANRKRLEGEGFPLPLPGFSMWSAAAVDNWCASDFGRDAVGTAAAHPDALRDLPRIVPLTVSGRAA